MTILNLRRAILLACAFAGLAVAACVDHQPTMPATASLKAGGTLANDWRCQYAEYPLGNGLYSFEIFCYWANTESGTTSPWQPPPDDAKMVAGSAPSSNCDAFPDACDPDGGGGSPVLAPVPIAGVNYPTVPGDDIGPELEPDMCNASYPMLGAIVAQPVEYLAEFLPREVMRSTGPSATDAILTARTDALPALPCLQCITRQVTAAESQDILDAARASGEWVYTQGGAKGGTEISKDFSATPKRGDCTDFTWNAATVSLGATWAHGWQQKLSTTEFLTMAGTELAAHGYVEVPETEARAGDVVVRGGHAGIYTHTDADGRIMGLANNGVPARSDGQKNFDGTTGEYDFSENHGFSPRFFRPLVCE